jgi:hypothetical protein
MAFTFLWARRARRCAGAVSLVDVEAITDLGIKHQPVRIMASTWAKPTLATLRGA